MRFPLLHISSLLLACGHLLQAADEVAVSFPSPGQERLVTGELVSVDFIHRAGQYRSAATGELVSFSLLPYGTAQHLNAEADLRDLPPGTRFAYFLHPDRHGRPTLAATMRDQFTMDSLEGVTYRLDEVQAGENKLLTTRRGKAQPQEVLGRRTLRYTPDTRIWRGTERIQPHELKPGEDLLFNLSGQAGTTQDICTEIWADTATHETVTRLAQERFDAFLKHRGLPGWVNETTSNTLTVTFFTGNPARFTSNYGPLLAQGKGGSVAVANSELRTWNPPVDKEGCSIVASHHSPPEAFGDSGFRVTLRPSNMLEGFRRGRVVRFFASGWQAKDQFYGESLMGYGYGRLQTPELEENPAREYPDQFPFRTDYGNEHLPWYQLQPGMAPPPFAEHQMMGALVKVDEASRSGQFRKDGTGELVDFSLLPGAFGNVRYLNQEASLADIPVGTRCRFHLFQDENGRFSKASLVMDEFTRLASNSIRYRIESIQPARQGVTTETVRLTVAWQIPEVKNYNGDMERPPDIGRSLLLLGKDSKIWKSTLDKNATLNDIAVGDVLIINLSGDQPGAPAVCTEVWVGEETFKILADQQKQKKSLARKP